MRRSAVFFFSAYAIEFLPPSCAQNITNSVNTLFGQRKICAFSEIYPLPEKAHIFLCVVLGFYVSMPLIFDTKNKCISLQKYGLQV